MMIDWQYDLYANDTFHDYATTEALPATPAVWEFFVDGLWQDNTSVGVEAPPVEVLTVRGSANRQYYYDRKKKIFLKEDREIMDFITVFLQVKGGRH